MKGVAEREKQVEGRSWFSSLNCRRSSLRWMVFNSMIDKATAQTWYTLLSLSPCTIFNRNEKRASERERGKPQEENEKAMRRKSAEEKKESFTFYVRFDAHWGESKNEYTWGKGYRRRWHIHTPPSSSPGKAYSLKIHVSINLCKILIFFTTIAPTNVNLFDSHSSTYLTH